KQSLHFYLTNPLLQPIPQNLNLQFHFTPPQIHPLHPPTTPILSLNPKHIPFIPHLHPTLPANNHLNRTYLFQLS
ncbi:hypothetical protein, partial [Staphylococcus epidermidis]|uniref:hypothetical protein n=1 Tax=Staphylococcus epidermidis TaxID=1282 RepID=UPI0037DA55F6